MSRNGDYLGFLIVNDYRWPFCAGHPVNSGGLGFYFNGNEADLAFVKENIDTLFEHYPLFDQKGMVLSKDLEKTINNINNLAIETKIAAANKDLHAVKKNYKLFGALVGSVKYDFSLDDLLEMVKPPKPY